MIGIGASDQAEMEAEYYDEEAAAGGGPEIPPPCRKGHRPSLALGTAEGGSICLSCFAALLSDPASPSHHVSYALSQLALAARNPTFLRNLRSFHSHLLVPPLVHALCSTDDDPLAHQLIDLVSDLCAGGHSSPSGDFIAWFTARLSSRPLAWSRRQIYMLHCLGNVLSSHQDGNIAARIEDKASLFSNLVFGLQLPSEEIRGEILFVLYKLAVLQATPWDDDYDGCAKGGENSLPASVGQLLRLSLEALLKTQRDDVRMNCIALLMVFARRGFFEDFVATGDGDARDTGYMINTNGTSTCTPSIRLFADAVKGPLLSSDTQVQISTLDLIFHALSSDTSFTRHIQYIIGDGIADYVFEILRLSGNNDSLVCSCLQVLVLLAKEEDTFRERLAIGFPTLLSVLHYVGDIPLHPVQSQVLNLVLNCISNCPGVVSISQLEEIVLILKGILTRCASGEIGMLSETFSLACSVFVEVLKSPSSSQIQKITPVIQEASRNAILSSILLPHAEPNSNMFYSLYLLKVTYLYCQEEAFKANSSNKELENSIIETCEAYLLPWLGKVVDEGNQEEEIVLEVLETFHLILLRGSEIKPQKFAETLASSSCFNLSFGCLALFPSDQMKLRVYLMLSSVIDKAICSDFGQVLRDSYEYLPSDPAELIFLLGQSSIDDTNLSSCQYAVVLMLYISSLFGERLVDDDQVLASLDQYILINCGIFACTVTNAMMLTHLVHLYGLLRGASISHGTHSSEAEKVLFDLIVENEWELLSVPIHPTSLKWIFQQELIMTPLAYHMLNFCRLYSSNKTLVNVRARCIQLVDIQMIADLVISRDNCAAPLLVSLLQQVHEEGREEETICVLNVIAGILKIFSDASVQFCLHGIGDAFHNVYYSVYSSPHIILKSSFLLFSILYCAKHSTPFHEGEWLSVTIKLLELLCPKLASNSCGLQQHLTIGIFCLILHHSTKQVLEGPAKAILLNSSLISAIDSIVQIAIVNGPALVEQNEETAAGKSLIFVLLLYSFALKSMHVFFQKTVDWQDFLQLPKGDNPLSTIHIKCHDLCRLIHFGSSVVKIVASECLVALLFRISQQRNHMHDEFRCSARYLKSVMAVIEGLVFSGDCTVAINCGVSLSVILTWEEFGLQTMVIKESKWCRLIMEELAMTLAAPSLASKSFTNQHKPAAHIAVALLRSNQKPGWIKSVFNASCIAGIIGNLSASNLSAEMVKLFRELICNEYLNEDQVASLHRLFQVCRKHLYSDSCKEKLGQEHLTKAIGIPDDIHEVCSLLFSLMRSPFPDPTEIQTENNRLLEEIDLFLKSSQQYNHN